MIGTLMVILFVVPAGLCAWGGAIHLLRYLWRRNP